MSPLHSIAAAACGTFKVLNSKGMHARPCAQLARCAAAYQSEIFVSYGPKRAEAKSLLELLILAAEPQAELKVEAIGIDAQQAVLAIIEWAKGELIFDR